MMSSDDRKRLMQGYTYAKIAAATAVKRRDEARDRLLESFSNQHKLAYDLCCQREFVWPSLCGIHLRVDMSQAESLLNDLCAVGLIERDENEYRLHPMQNFKVPL
jgi:hypothetical protein